MIERRLLIVGHAIHKLKGNELYSYSPFVKEMNLWTKKFNKVVVVAPYDSAIPGVIDLAYEHNDIKLVRVPSISLLSIREILFAILVLPYIFFVIVFEMFKTDHIHLRCPGNIGLIGCFCQMLFPWKKKTAKYAGNWDWNSNQPWSYRLQQKILRNTFFTHNIQTLVYGDWPDKTRNIKSFFTASYSETGKLPVDLQKKASQLSHTVRFAFVGTLTPNKQPLFCLEVVKLLKDRGVNVKMDFCGDGSQRSELQQYVDNNGLNDNILLHGNKSAEEVKVILQNSHFLLFASISEGWPKAVAEAMWWGCVPVTTSVSCVPYMLGYGSRGTLITGNVAETADVIVNYIADRSSYINHASEGMTWARQFTVELFESEIMKLV
jgi:glycosyltransferase involved in cell wall biosynthesis